MSKPFRRLIEDLPAECRERIEAHMQALLKEYRSHKPSRTVTGGSLRAPRENRPFL